MIESDVQKILDHTNDGLKVFVHYLGKVRQGVTFRNPYRDDERPSCRLYHRKNNRGVGRWYLKDYGDSDWCGDCFWFVATICHLNLKTDFRDILHIIDKDLGLFILEDTQPSSISYQMMEKREVQPSHYSQSKIVGFLPEFQPFTASELAFWSKYGITAAVLYRYGVRSIKHCLFTREDGSTYTGKSSSASPIFAYVNTFPLYAPDGKKSGEVLKGMKIYRPKSKNSRFMYVGELPKPYVFGDRSWIYGQSGKEDVVYITGGEKDTLTLLSHGYHAICFNSETAHISHVVMESLVKKFRWVVFLYDCDATGEKESSARVQEFQSRYPSVCRVVLPLAGTKAEKDVSDFFALGHSTEELDALTLSAIDIASNYKNQDTYENIDHTKHPKPG